MQDLAADTVLTSDDAGRSAGARTADRVLAQGKSLVEAGRWEEAKAALEAGLRDFGDNAALHEQFGLMLYNDGDRKGALPHLKDALRLGAPMGEGCLALLRAVIDDEERPAAEAVASDVLAAGPQDSRILTLVAKAFRRNGSYGRAGEVWLQVAQLRPSDLQACMEAAEAFVRAKDFKAALDAASRASALKPMSEEPILLKLQILERMKAEPADVGKVIRDLARVNVSAAFDQVPTLISLGLYELVAELILLCKRQGVELDQVLLTSLTKSLKAAAGAAERAQTFEVAGRFWQALRVIDEQDAQAAKRLKSALTALTKQGRGAVERGELPLAEAKFRTIVTLDASRTRNWSDLCSVLEKSKRWAEAAETWLRCAEQQGAAGRDTSVERAVRVAQKVEAPSDQVRIMVHARDLAPRSAEVSTKGYRSFDRLVRSVSTFVKERTDADLTGAVADYALLRRWDAMHAKMQRVHRKLAKALKTRVQEASHRNDDAQAAALSELLLSIEPNSVLALRLTARQAMREHRPQYAAELYQRLVDIDPMEERNYAKLARAFKAMRMYDQGIPVVQRLLELYPDHAAGRQLLSEMLHGQAISAV